MVEVHIIAGYLAFVFVKFPYQQVDVGMFYAQFLERNRHADAVQECLEA